MEERFRKEVLVEFNCCITVYGLRLKQITGSSLMILAQEDDNSEVDVVCMFSDVLVHSLDVILRVLLTKKCEIKPLNKQ